MECYPEYPHYFTLIAAAYWLLICFVGGFGNLLVLIALPYARRRCSDPRSPLKSCTTVLLLSLSLADCLFCFITLGGSAITMLIGKWYIGSGLCYATSFVSHILGIASPSSLAAATMSRTMELWWPSGAAVIFEAYNGIPSVIGVWLLASIAPVLGAVQNLFGYNPIPGCCVIISVDQTTSNIAYGLCIGIPWVVVLVCLILIWVKLSKNWSELKQFKDVGQSTLRELKNRERKMALLLTLLAAAYSSTTAPVVALYVFSEGGPWAVPYIYFTFLMLYYYAINVFLYFYRIQSYRDAFLRLYKDACKCGCRQLFRLRS